MPVKRNEKIYIGGIEKRDIIIGDYDPEWPKLYNQHAKRINKALGSKILRLEHIGSTSVAGLAAKPIIDILVEIEDTSREELYVPLMDAAGYQLRIREPDWYEHRMFRTPNRETHIHFYPQDCPEIKRVLRFRDWLRKHPEELKRYENIKRELAKREWGCGDDYADAKTEVIENIIAKSLKNESSGQ